MKYTVIVILALMSSRSYAAECAKIKDGVWSMEAQIATQGNAATCTPTPKKVGISVKNGEVSISSTGVFQKMKLTCFTIHNGCSIFASCAVPMTEKGSYSVAWTIELQPDGTPKSGLRQEVGTGVYCSGRALTGKFVKGNKL